MYEQLKLGLDPSAAFWADHHYFDPNTPFFSYLYNLVWSLLHYTDVLGELVL